MRQLKFRIWNGQQMEYNIMAGFLGAFYVQGIDEKDSASMSPFNTKYHEDTPVMQFTGLTDKNGKKVYEGDIVEVDNGPISVITTCIFETGQFGLVDNTFGNWTRQLYHQKERLTIIGNIFENADLLEVK